MANTKQENGSSASTNGPGSATKEWDEARLQAALTRVQEMHVQLRQLRDTVPSLLRPIHKELSSPETLYAEFRSAATNVVSNMQDFQGKMKEPRTKDIMKRVKDSKEQTSDGIESWLVSQHADWLDQPVIRSANKVKTEEDFLSEEKADEKPQETIAQTVQNFKVAHSDITVKLDEGKRNINLSLPSPAKFIFNVSWETPQTPQTPPTFKVQPRGNSRMHQTMGQFLAKRPRADDLPWTLEMLASYFDLRTRRCDKCGKLMNYANEFAVMREGQTIKNENGTKTTTWKSYHLGCQP